MKNTITLLLVIFSCLSMSSQELIDYLNVGNTIEFNGQKMVLRWSSHPMELYYLQEWIPEDETFDNYSQMFTVAVILSEEVTPQLAVQMKIQELEERAKTDACCNYQVYENNDEYILDFLVSDGNGETLNCVEWDIHHYKTAIINGKKAQQLNYISTRAYGDDILPFLESIKDKRVEWINALTQMDIKCEIKE